MKRLRNGVEAQNIADLKDLVEGPFHSPETLVNDEIRKRYIFAPRGILKDKEGNIAGIWIKNKKGKRYVYLFAKPIPPAKQNYKIEYKDVVIDGKLYKGVAVKVYPKADTLFQWSRRHR